MHNIKAPSKKILFLLGTVTAFFVAFFGYGPAVNTIRNIDLRGSLSYSGNGAGLSTENIQNNKDSDGDGLKDWQETLWKTNPNKVDTDGDGTNDGEEVAAGRDPNIAGPDDKITHSLELTASADSTLNTGDSDNLSEQLSKNLFAQFMSVQGNNDGQALDDTTQTQIITNTLSNLKPENIPNRYTFTDVKTFDPTNKAKQKEFGNELITIPQQTASLLTPDTENEAAISIYSDLADQMAAIEVPSDMVPEYLSLLNNFYASTELLKIITEQAQDPVKVLLATKSGEEVNQKNQDIYTEFASYFKKNAIIWDDNEPGSVWEKI